MAITAAVTPPNHSSKHGYLHVQPQRVLLRDVGHDNDGQSCSGHDRLFRRRRLRQSQALLPLPDDAGDVQPAEAGQVPRDEHTVVLVRTRQLQHLGALRGHGDAVARLLQHLPTRLRDAAVDGRD